MGSGLHLPHRGPGCHIEPYRINFGGFEIRTKDKGGNTMSKSSRRILFVPILLLVAGVSLGQTATEKFPAGFSAPLHTHTATHKVVVISGTWIHGEPGKPDARLGPGSYLVQPSGMKHTTACDAASECVFFIES